jgi:hypothetical protein
MRTTAELTDSIKLYAVLSHYIIGVSVISSIRLSRHLLKWKKYLFSRINYFQSNYGVQLWDPCIILIIILVSAYICWTQNWSTYYKSYMTRLPEKFPIWNIYQTFVSTVLRRKVDCLVNSFIVNIFPNILVNFTLLWKDPIVDQLTSVDSTRSHCYQSPKVFNSYATPIKSFLTHFA